jgi:hypothetical protein
VCVCACVCVCVFVCECARERSCGYGCVYGASGGGVGTEQCLHDYPIVLSSVNLVRFGKKAFDQPTWGIKG